LRCPLFSSHGPNQGPAKVEANPFATLKGHARNKDLQHFG
jgi:hypothetical protein